MGSAARRPAASPPTQSSAFVVRRLLARGLVDVESIVDGDLVVVDATRRNRNLKVLRVSGPSYVVKQGVNEDGRETVAYEARIYELLRREAEPGIGKHLPRLFEFDPETGMLVLELFADASDLREHHLRLARFPTGLAADLGRALADLHRTSADAAGLLTRPAWVLSVHRPALRRFWEMSGATVALTRIVQQFDELCAMLDELLAGWRVETLIHHDVKWENCVVLTGRRGRGRVKIVDWEFAGPGDPCWDVGSVFGSYLSTWLLSIPLLGSEFDDRSLALASLPLERMQPSINTFWSAYVAQRGLVGEEVATALIRAVRYSGARLLQTAYEQMQVSPQLNGNVVGGLQLALNVMARPLEACVALLGIPLPRRLA